MQTVKVNRKAVAALAGVVFLFLCVLSYYPGYTSQSPRVVRHLGNRELAKQQESKEIPLKKLQLDDTKREVPVERPAEDSLMDSKAEDGWCPVSFLFRFCLQKKNVTL